MQQPQVWLVEDEQGIADTLIYTLQLEGFTVELFARGLPALEKSASATAGCGDSRCGTAGYQRL
ncbi:two-component response regulator [Salmonella enterica subsp. enterica]|uniref:Two-component response regulator n=1 Tax=Salmonella enterica I TaxID=59201 RepID=A0A447TN07_SALET|nr:two-component response regulator [Salmonella enterica subsp. enterica]